MKSLTAPLEGDDLKVLKRLKRALERSKPLPEDKNNKEGLRRTGYGYYLGKYYLHHVTKTGKAGWFKELSECIEIAEGKIHHCFGWWGVVLTTMDELEQIYPQNLEPGQEVKVWARSLDYVAKVRQNAPRFSRETMFGSKEPPLPGYFDSQEFQQHLTPSRFRCDAPSIGEWSAMFVRLVDERLEHLEASLQANHYLEAQELHRFIWEMLNGLSAKATAAYWPEGRREQVESALTLAEEQIKDALA